MSLCACVCMTAVGGSSGGPLFRKLSWRYPQVPGKKPDDSSCRLSKTPSSYKASFCTIFWRAGLMMICGGSDEEEELPTDEPGQRQ